MWKQKNNRVNKNDNIEFNTFRNYTTLYHTYKLLYCKGHNQITSIHSNVNVETKNNRVKKDNIEFKTLKNYITLYQTYPLLYYKGHIRITSIHSDVNVETKK